LVERDVNVFCSHFNRVLLVVSADVARGAGDGIAIFVETGSDVDLAGEWHAHHGVVLAERVINRERRPVDFFYGQGRTAAASGGACNDEQRRVRIDVCFELGIDGDFAANLS